MSTPVKQDKKFVDGLDNPGDYKHLYRGPVGKPTISMCGIPGTPIGYIPKGMKLCPTCKMKSPGW